MKAPVVVKLGSSLVADARGRPRRRALRAVAAELAAVDVPICVVSSGAIALGLGKMGLDRRPRALPKLQAASALGQAALQRVWEDALGAHGLRAGQVLLTSTEIADRRAYVNVRNALGALFSLGVVPVVNENDATATDEISFGDNDALAAQVAVLVRARLLVLLTSVEGVLTELGGELIADGAGARAAVFGARSAAGSGGMASKLAAAKIAAWSGVRVVIAAANEPDVVRGAIDGRPVGTAVRARSQRLSSRKLWIAFARGAAGRVTVDAGAQRALMHQGRSLLPAGVRDVEGTFAAEDAVEIVGDDGRPFAKGLVRYSATALRQVAGRRTADLPDGQPHEVIHRDDLVVLP